MNQFALVSDDTQSVDLQNLAVFFAKVEADAGGEKNIEMSSAEWFDILRNVRGGIAPPDMYRFFVDSVLVKMATMFGSLEALHRDCPAPDALKAERARQRAAIDELDHKTNALRELQRERDPSRIEALVAERVKSATATLDSALSQARRQCESAQREIEELRASKKKLREALERAKERR